MSRFDQLLEFLVSIPALILLLGGAFFFSQAVKYLWLRWVLFGGTMYVASMAKYYDQWEDLLWFPFNPPIESIVINGRPIAAVLLGFLIFLAFLTGSSLNRFKVAGMMGPIHAMQILILFKVFEGNGLSAYVLQAATIFICIGLVSAVGVRSWVWQHNPVEMLALALCVAGGSFALVVVWHLQTNPASIMRAGRLMGTTANPQHAAVLLGLSFLGPAYFFATFRNRKRIHLIVVALLAAALLYLLLLTGSRTGVGLVLIGTIFLFRGRIGMAAAFGIVVAVAVFVLLQQFSESADVERLVSTEDTRSHVWLNQWNTFLQYPVFGAPQRGAQFRSAENSWLGLLAAAGIIGGMCLVWLVYEYGRASLALWHLRNRSDFQIQVNFCLAGITTVLAGSFFEAYLFGVITFPVLFVAALAPVCEHTIHAAYCGNRLPRPQFSESSSFSRHD